MRPSFLDSMSYAMSQVYASVTDKILVNIAHYFPMYRPGQKIPGAFEYQARMLAQVGQVNRESIDIIMKNLEGADTVLRKSLEAAIKDALKDEEPKLRKAAEEGLLNGAGFLPPEVTPNQMQAFQTYYAQSADKLNLVNTVMLESTQDAYRATVADVVQRINQTQTILNVGAGEVVTGVSAWNSAMHDSVRKMVKNGLTGFIDHAGRRWSPEAYVAMDIRTTMFNTAREAVWENADSFGSDLYQVSSHIGARPLCYPWQGKVISRTDTVRDVEDLYGNKIHVYAQSETTYGQAAGLFGINCKHYPMTFIPKVSTLRGEPQDPEENEKAYEESQQQRALERKLRGEKLELDLLKAQGADEETIRAQREKVRAASADIDDFCDKTGRARRRNREYTPINATFPDKDSYNPADFPTEQKDRITQFFGGQATPSKVGEVKRPDNEQEVLKQFAVYDPSTKTDAEKLAQINPNYSTDERKWTYNCQRTVTAQELVYRGYNVTAMPYNPNDPIKSVMWNAWEVEKDKFKDPFMVWVDSRNDLGSKIKEAFDEWGDGARAVVRLKYGKAHGNNGHFIFARRINGKIEYTDGQSNEIVSIEDEAKKCTTGKKQLWCMRVDNRRANKNIVYAVKNVEE